jgi:hypothetical protein
LLQRSGAGHRKGNGIGCWPGNTNDQAVLPQVTDDLRAWRGGRVVTVVDRGFSSASNLNYLRRAGGHFIAGERMRAGTPHVEQVLGRQGRYRQVRDNLRVKEVRLDSAPDLRWVLCHNPDEAARSAAQRQAALERIGDELARIAAARSRLATTKPATAAATRRREAEVAAHTRAECALRDHPALGRWLRQTPSGRLVLDTVKIRAEARLDGKYLLVTSDPDLAAEDVALGYKNLLEAERGFRDLKSTVELRPVYHRLEPRIRAHVLLCWLALLLIRVAERRTGSTWPTLARELGRLHAVTLTGPTGTVTQTTEPTTAQQGILRACWAHATTPDHSPRSGLTCTSAEQDPAGTCSHTPRTPADAHRHSSTPRFGSRVDLPTAEPGARGQRFSVPLRPSWVSVLPSGAGVSVVATVGDNYSK